MGKIYSKALGEVNGRCCKSSVIVIAGLSHDHLIIVVAIAWPRIAPGGRRWSSGEIAPNQDYAGAAARVLLSRIRPRASRISDARTSAFDMIVV